MQSNKPWVLIKGTDAEKERAGTIIGLASNVSALLCIMMKPYMPLISAELQRQLALPADKIVVPDNFIQLLPTGHVTKDPVPLFQKLEPSFGEEMKARFGGKQEAAVRFHSISFFLEFLHTGWEVLLSEIKLCVKSNNDRYLHNYISRFI